MEKWEEPGLLEEILISAQFLSYAPAVIQGGQEESYSGFCSVINSQRINQIIIDVDEQVSLGDSRWANLLSIFECSVCNYIIIGREISESRHPVIHLTPLNENDVYKGVIKLLGNNAEDTVPFLYNLMENDKSNFDRFLKVAASFPYLTTILRNSIDQGMDLKPDVLQNRMYQKLIHQYAEDNASVLCYLYTVRHMNVHIGLSEFITLSRESLENVQSLILIDAFKIDETGDLAFSKDFWDMLNGKLHPSEEVFFRVGRFNSEKRYRAEKTVQMLKSYSLYIPAQNEQLLKLKQEILESDSYVVSPKPLIPNYEEDQNYIFISYSHKDYKSVFCDLIELYNNNVRFWYDKGLEAGPDWDKIIKAKLTSPYCVGVIFYISKFLFLSRSISNEVRFTIERNIPESDLKATGINYFCVNLDGDQPSKIYRKIIRNYSDDDLDKFGMDSELLTNILGAFTDKGTYIVKVNDAPSDTGHITDVIAQIRRKFNVIDG